MSRGPLEVQIHHLQSGNAAHPARWLSPTINTKLVNPTQKPQE
jgi:hypothetical protein